jgi:putative tricarboxylic transport membrane protein
MDRIVRKEMASSLVLLLFGLGYLLFDLKYSLDTWANPGPGIFPLMAGGVLVILSVYQSVQVFRRRRRGEGEGTCVGNRSILELLKAAERKPLLMIGLFVIYLLMVQWVGFFISDFLFVVFCSKLIGAKGWGRAVAFSAGVNLFCYFLFEVWLKLSFPRGVLF